MQIDPTADQRLAGRLILSLVKPEEKKKTHTRMAAFRALGLAKEFAAGDEKSKRLSDGPSIARLAILAREDERSGWI